MTETLIEPTPEASEAEVAGISTSPSLKLLIGAALVALFAVGIVSLILWLVRPVGEVVVEETSAEPAPVEPAPVTAKAVEPKATEPKTVVKPE